MYATYIYATYIYATGISYGAESALTKSFLSARDDNCSSSILKRLLGHILSPRCRRARRPVS